MNMSNPKARNPSKHIPNPRTPHPDPHPQRLLDAPIEHAEDDHSPRIDASFEHAQKRTRSRQAREVVGGSMTHEDDAPSHNGAGHELAHWQTLQEQVGGILPEEVAEIEERAEPGVLRAHETGFFAEVEDGGVAEGGLVDGLEHVGDASVRVQHLGLVHTTG